MATSRASRWLSTAASGVVNFIFHAPAGAFAAREVRVIDERVASDHRPVLTVRQAATSEPPRPQLNSQQLAEAQKLSLEWTDKLKAARK